MPRPPLESFALHTDQSRCGSMETIRLHGKNWRFMVCFISKTGFKPVAPARQEQVANTLIIYLNPHNCTLLSHCLLPMTHLGLVFTLTPIYSGVKKVYLKEITLTLKSGISKNVEKLINSVSVMFLMKELLIFTSK